MRSFMIVVRGNRNKNNLQPINEYALYRMPDGSIINGMPSAPMDSPFTVGLTSHTKIRNYEMLHRVNTLMLSSEAQATKSTTFVEKLGNLGLNPFSQKT